MFAAGPDTAANMDLRSCFAQVCVVAWFLLTTAAAGGTSIGQAANDVRPVYLPTETLVTRTEADRPGWFAYPLRLEQPAPLSWQPGTSEAPPAMLFKHPPLAAAMGPDTAANMTYAPVLHRLVTFTMLYALRALTGAC
ncbi:hypothetical protein HPB48_022071 [Haemaphysalis longicornis]|uniref:Uncharacterized protein n=1 Tax=Haemaphysalis longicornis TaxID=44386 RepID=A0A9J6FNT8_HAELO|nr:hypothetical protein HPB48_022071 [Haemaphysalis longicornis]